MINKKKKKNVMITQCNILRIKIGQTEKL